MRPTQTDQSLKYEFTGPELLQLGRTMAQERFFVEDCEKHKADAVAFFKEAIEKHEEEVYRLAGLIRNGYEFRWVRCVIHYNDPNVGEKSFYRMDSGELVCTAPMTDAERQDELPIDSTPPESGEMFPPDPPSDGKSAGAN